MVGRRDLDKYAPSHLRDWDSDGDDWRMVEGTLCLVDISGFTALSEKLAALGRIGAEELTEVLGWVFGDMLDIASARGGTLLKFGPGLYAFVRVADDGPGIDRDAQERIFEPFVSSKGKHRGIGLSTVLGIARAHHALLQLESAPGRGASFGIYLDLTG